MEIGGTKERNSDMKNSEIEHRENIENVYQIPINRKIYEKVKKKKGKNRISLGKGYFKTGPKRRYLSISKKTNKLQCIHMGTY